MTSWNQDFWEKYKQPRHADDTTLLAESEEELKSLLIRVKEESDKAGLKLTIQKPGCWGLKRAIALRYAYS